MTDKKDEAPAQQEEPTKAVELVDALIAKYSDKLFDSVGPHDAAKFEEDCNRIKQTLAEQPAQQQEPVAWRYLTQYENQSVWTYCANEPANRKTLQPLYTSPQPAQQEPVAWPCVIAEADFEQNTITLEMQCSDYKVGVGKHWLSTSPQPAQQEPTKAMIDAAEHLDWSDADVRGNIVNMWQAMIAAAPHPAQPSKPLTDEQILDAYMKAPVDIDCHVSDLHKFARAIEAAHGIKENT